MFLTNARFNQMIKRCLSTCFLAMFFASCQEQGEKLQCEIEEVFSPVLVEVFSPAPPFLGTDQKYHLLYGLKLTNASNLPARLQSIDVTNYCKDGEVIHSFAGEELVSNLARLNAAPAETPDLDVDVTRIFFVKLAFDEKESIPRSLQHRISLEGANGPGSKDPVPVTYQAGSFCVCKKELLSLAPPLQGQGWTIFNACCSSEGAHQNSLLPVNGFLYNAQRFAIDFMKLDEDNTLYKGDPTDPVNWHSYNESVYAVAEGEVVSVLEGLDDQPPGALPDPESITLKTVTGNHVIIKLQPHVYAFYAHLKKDSILVKVGDKVSKGQEIAKLGNSGNTSAPHLHLHLMSTPSPVGSAPIPYTYDKFAITGLIKSDSFYDHDDLEHIQVESIPAEERKNQFPLDLNVVEFR